MHERTTVPESGMNKAVDEFIHVSFTESSLSAIETRGGLGGKGDWRTYRRWRFFLPAFSRFVVLRADGGIGLAVNSGGNRPIASLSASRS